MDVTEQTREPEDDLSVPVTIDLGSGCGRLATVDRVHLFEERLASELGSLLSHLGVPGGVTVATRGIDSARAVRIRAHGALAPYPPDLMERLWRALAPPELHHLSADLRDGRQAGFPDGWFAGYVSSVAASDQPDWGLAFAFVGRLVVEVIRERPACLIGPRQAEAYVKSSAARSPRSRGGPSTNYELQVIRSLLDLGVSVADRSVVIESSAEGSARQRSIEGTVEDAFAQLRPGRIEIRAHPKYLRRLFPGEPFDEPLSVYAEQVGERGGELFRSLERELLVELGIQLPDLVWVPRRRLAEGTVAIKINDRSGAPAIVAGARHREELQLELVARTLSREIRRRADWLLDIEDVEYQLSQLEQRFPALVEVAMGQITLEDLTRVLRGLLAEGISIHDLKAILDRLLQYDTVPAQPHGHMVLDGRLPTRGEPQSGAGSWRHQLEFVRGRFGDRLCRANADSREALHAFLVDPLLERAIESHDGRPSGASALGEEEQEALRNDLWGALGRVPDAGIRPVIYTTSEARWAIRELIAPELPDMAVVSSREVPPGMAIHPLATISAPALP